MSSSKQIVKEIMEITTDLIGLGLSMDQNFPSEKTERGLTIIGWGNQINLSIVLKNVGYNQIYDELLKNNNYNIKLIDGAIIQMMYTFEHDILLSHRLAFFPSPELESYQNDPEIYERQEIYADIIAKNIIPFPMRFDFDADEKIFEPIKHPRSHLTLGQYKNCRIPVSAPLTPEIFIDFILRNFYSTAYYYYQLDDRQLVQPFDRTISDEEERVLHVNFFKI
ncbi:MAG TPA: DUF2290 domain-containing protein [Bacillus bacterium]|nr:DUF2290 domain-containing protein [Bacillus sp. (in: firmicutes)]